MRPFTWAIMRRQAAFLQRSCSVPAAFLRQIFEVDPRGGQTGERPHPDRTQARGAACSVAAYFHDPTEFPVVD